MLNFFYHCVDDLLVAMGCFLFLNRIVFSLTHSLYHCTIIFIDERYVTMYALIFARYALGMKFMTGAIKPLIYSMFIIIKLSRFLYHCLLVKIKEIKLFKPTKHIISIC